MVAELAPGPLVAVGWRRPEIDAELDFERGEWLDVLGRHAAQLPQKVGRQLLRYRLNE